MPLRAQIHCDGLHDRTAFIRVVGVEVAAIEAVDRHPVSDTPGDILKYARGSTSGRRSFVPAAFLLMLLALVLGMSSSARGSEPPFERVDAMILPSGEWALRSAAIEAGGRFAFFGRYSVAAPSRVTLVDLETFQRVTSREIADVPGFIAATSEPVRNYSYFLTRHNEVVRVQRQTVVAVTVINTTTLATLVGTSQMGAALMDPAGNYAYFGIGGEPSRIIKVRLDDFSVHSTLTLNSGENNIRAAVIDPTGVFGYFGLSTSPGRVVKVHLPTMQRVASVQVATFVADMAITPGGTRLYAMYPGGGMAEVELATFTVSDGSSWQPGTRSSVIDPQGRYLHVGTAVNRILRIDLDTLEPVAELTLPTGEANFTSALLSPDGMFAYFGTNRLVESGGTEPGQIIKVRVNAPSAAIFGDGFEGPGTFQVLP